MPKKKSVVQPTFRMSRDDAVNLMVQGLPTMGKALDNAISELRRCSGILTAATQADGHDGLVHRVKSLRGHDKALEEVVTTVELLRDTLVRLSDILGV